MFDQEAQKDSLNDVVEHVTNFHDRGDKKKYILWLWLISLVISIIATIVGAVFLSYYFISSREWEYSLSKQGNYDSYYFSKLNDYQFEIKKISSFYPAAINIALGLGVCMTIYSIVFLFSRKKFTFKPLSLALLFLFSSFLLFSLSIFVISEGAPYVDMINFINSYK